MIKRIWEIWAKAIGPKAVENCDKTSDLVAIIRTAILLIYIITNFFIIAGIIRHW
jgi:hypothetical protein